MLRRDAFRNVLRMVVLLSLAWVAVANAQITRKAFFEMPSPVYTISLDVMDALSDSAWSDVVNVFSNPLSMAMLAEPDGQSVSEYFFVLDAERCVLRHFSTLSNLALQREIEYFDTYGTGFGHTTGKYANPTAVSVSPRGPGGIRYVYVLDSGNNRIEKLRYDMNQWTMQHVSFVYDDQQGTGVLDHARDVDYCALRDDDDADNDLLLIADTGNNRVIGLRPDGTVKWTFGGPNPGGGSNQLSYPVAVTAIRVSPDDDAALIYVADRGNNRIVKLYQESDWGVRWIDAFTFPSDNASADPSSYMGGYVNAGMEDVEVDPNGIFSGVFALDSRTGQVIQLDYGLHEILQSLAGFDEFGLHPYSLEFSRGEMAVMCPYSTTTGPELYEIRATVEKASIHPSKIVAPLEWTQASFAVTSAGTLDVWVEDDGGHEVNKLRWAWPVHPGLEYAIWDGRDATGAWVSNGDYTIFIRVKDAYWHTSNTKSVVVEVTANQNIATLPIATGGIVSHWIVQDPHWSPDGKRLVYSATVGSEQGIVVYDLESQTEQLLTAGEDGLRQIQPTWSHDGAEIAWTKELANMDELHLYRMHSDGTNREAISHAPGHIREYSPVWFADDMRLGYVKHANADSVLSKDIATGQQILLHVRQFVWETDEISFLDLSPNQTQILMASDFNGAIADDVLSKSLLDGSIRELTVPTEDDRIIMGMAWAPDGERIALTEWGRWNTSEYPNEQWESKWNVVTIPRNGGDASIVSGLSSSSALLRPGICWSPDGTKLALPIIGISTTDLVIADFQRAPVGAFPAAKITAPSPGDTLLGIAYITGEVDTNFSVLGATLSIPHAYHVEWGIGDEPENWFRDGITLMDTGGDWIVEDDTLASLNTGYLHDGVCTLRLVATDGVDSNTVYRRVFVKHRVLTVMVGGGGQFTRIQDAIDAAELGDTVLVSSGTYEENITVRSMVPVMAASSGVVLVGQGGVTNPKYAVTIQDDEYPAMIRGLEVRHESGYTPLGGGILVKNARASIEDCAVLNHTASLLDGPALKIIGESTVDVRGTSFEGNSTDKNGGAVAVVGGNGEHPTARFVSCQFSNNVAGYGGGVWIDFDAFLDSTFVQPAFERCAFVGNRASTGSAVYAVNTWAVMFSNSTFHENDYRTQALGSNAVSGPQTGGSFIGCTFANNDVEDVIELSGFSGNAGSVGIDHCLVAYNINATAISTAYQSRYSVVRSDLFGNKTGDDVWLATGHDNRNVEPAFCDVENGDLNLQAYSPCSAAVSAYGRVGSEGVACVPNAIVEAGERMGYEPDSLLFGCPQGDGDTLVVTVDFQGAAVSRDLNPDELTIAPPYSNCEIYADRYIEADSATTTQTERTTLTWPFLSGSGENALVVNLNFVPLSMPAHVKRRGVDLVANGVIDNADFGVFGDAWEALGGTYADSCDFNNDGAINSKDFLYFGNHWQHQSPFLNGQAVAAAPQVFSSGTIDLSFVEDNPTIGPRMLKCYLTLGNVEPFRNIVAVFSNANASLRYKSWHPDPNYPKATMCAPIHRDGHDEIIVGIVGGKNVDGTRLPIGYFDTTVLRSGVLEMAESDYQLVSADLLQLEGGTLEFRGSQVSRKQQSPHYSNELAQNYPNPFNPSTTISYSLAKESNVDLKVFDVTGAVVKNLVEGRREPNRYRVVWDGRNNTGNPVASGVYFYRLTAGDFQSTKKMVLIR